jgi:hypothetical protein
MDDRNRPDTNVVLLRRKGDPSEAERERVASTIFAEPDDIATSRAAISYRLGQTPAMRTRT